MIKSVRHFRLDTEREVLKRFQTRAPSLRPLIDEIEEPSDPPALVLRHLDDDVLHASAVKRFTGPEIKYVIRNVLEALQVLHEDGYVHTGLKSSTPSKNALCSNYSLIRRCQAGQRFSQLWRRSNEVY